MKRTTELKPWQHHAAKSLSKVGETAAITAVCIGAAWACRRWLYPDCKTTSKEEAEQPEVRECSGLKNGAFATAEKLSDVAGMDEVKAELNEKIIQPFKRPELFERFKLRRGGGILLYGPPGTGKTLIARAIAAEVDAKFFPLNPAEIKSKWVGETEKNLQRVFDEARRHPKSVVFLDEVDALLAARGNRKVTAVTQFLSCSDGLTKTADCLLLLAATNRPWMLDPAAIRPGRLSTHIYCPPPDMKAREAILAFNLNGVPQDISMAEIAGSTDGYSGADLAALSDCAKRAAKNRQISSGRSEVVTTGDFAEAIGKIHPSVSAIQLKQFEAWRKDHQRLAEIDDEEE